MAAESEPTQDALEDAELCLSCLHPNRQNAHFCGKCGAPLTSYSATAPFESIFAEGHLYRAAVENPRHWMVLAGIWFYFGTLALGGILTVVKGLEDWSSLGFGLLILSFSVVIIARSTINFRRLRIPVTRDP